MDFHQRLHCCGLLIYSIQHSSYNLKDYCKTREILLFSDYDNYDKENKSKREDCCDIFSKTDCKDNEIKLNSAVIDKQGLSNLTIINISLWYMTVYPSCKSEYFIQCRML